MIPTRAVILFTATLLASACDWKRSSQDESPALAPGSSQVEETRPAPPLQATEQAANVPAASANIKMPREVENTEEILVNGEPRCAIRLRYGMNSHEVTWLGPCGSMTAARMFTVDDLKMFEGGNNVEKEKALEKARAYLPLMPNGRALYIEGNSTSVLYLEFQDIIDEVPLAD